MPIPSGWSVAVAAPAYHDPYQALEATVGPHGSVILGSAAGEVAGAHAPATQQASGGHVRELLDWRNSPAVWGLAALVGLLALLHWTLGIGGEAHAGPARAGLEAEI